jgi:hypothetical protein
MDAAVWSAHSDHPRRGHLRTSRVVKILRRRQTALKNEHGTHGCAVALRPNRATSAQAIQGAATSLLGRLAGPAAQRAACVTTNIVLRVGAGVLGEMEVAAGVQDFRQGKWATGTLHIVAGAAGIFGAVKMPSLCFHIGTQVLVRVDGEVPIALAGYGGGTEGAGDADYLQSHVVIAASFVAVAVVGQQVIDRQSRRKRRIVSGGKGGDAGQLDSTGGDEDDEWTVDWWNNMRDDDIDDDTFDDEIDLDARDRALLTSERFDDLVDAVAIGVDASVERRDDWDVALLSISRRRSSANRPLQRSLSRGTALRDSPPCSERLTRNECRRVGGSPRGPTATHPNRLGRAWLIVGLLFAAFFGIRAIPSRSASESTMGASLYAPTAESRPRYVTRNIEDLQVGDTVIAADPETGEVGPRLIVQKFERTAYKLCVLELTTDDGLTQTLEPTPEHPFYLPATNEWREAGELNPGDQVLDPAGALQTVVANRIDDHPEGVPVYNMEVEGLHTYFVSAHGARAPPVLVHNTDGIGCGVKAPRSNRQLVQDIATRAQRKIGGTGRFAGIDKHSYARSVLDRYQAMFGSRGLQTETSWANRTPVSYGTKGSSRLDVLDTNSGVVFDYKFVMPSHFGGGLRARQRNTIMANGPQNIIQVIEINP